MRSAGRCGPPGSSIPALVGSDKFYSWSSASDGWSNIHFQESVTEQLGGTAVVGDLGAGVLVGPDHLAGLVHRTSPPVSRYAAPARPRAPSPRRGGSCCRPCSPRWWPSACRTGLLRRAPVARSRPRRRWAGRCEDQAELGVVASLRVLLGHGEAAGHHVGVDHQDLPDAREVLDGDLVGGDQVVDQLAEVDAVLLQEGAQLVGRGRAVVDQRAEVLVVVGDRAAEQGQVAGEAADRRALVDLGLQHHARVADQRRGDRRSWRWRSR